MHQLLLFCFQGFLVFTLTVASSCCHSANDTILASPDYISPCGILGTANQLSCCGLQVGEVCLSDGFCHKPGSDLYWTRGSTDPTYSASECPLYYRVPLCLVHMLRLAFN